MFLPRINKTYPWIIAKYHPYLFHWKFQRAISLTLWNAANVCLKDYLPHTAKIHFPYSVLQHCLQPGIWYWHLTKIDQDILGVIPNLATKLLCVISFIHHQCMHQMNWIFIPANKCLWVSKPLVARTKDPFEIITCINLSSYLNSDKIHFLILGRIVKPLQEIYAVAASHQ